MVVVRFDGGAHQPQNEETTLRCDPDSSISRYSFKFPSRKKAAAMAGFDPGDEEWAAIEPPSGAGSGKRSHRSSPSVRRPAESFIRGRRLKARTGRSGNPSKRGGRSRRKMPPPSRSFSPSMTSKGRTQCQKTVCYRGQQNESMRERFRNSHAPSRKHGVQGTEL